MNDTGYRDWLIAHGLSSNTIKQRVEFYQRRLDDWGTLDVPAYHVAGWLRQFHGWTFNTYRTHLRSIYAYLLETGAVEVDPTARIRRAPNPPPRPAPIPLAQLHAILASADGHLRTWILLGYLAGLRCHEIAKIRGEDVTSQYLFVHGKGGRAAHIPTHELLWDVAQNYPRTGWWFPSPHGDKDHISTGQIGTKIRAHFRAHGIESGAVHRLRHSYGTSLSRSGVNIRVVQELLRHASLDTTQRYIGVDEDEKRSAIALLQVA